MAEDGEEARLPAGFEEQETVLFEEDLRFPEKRFFLRERLEALRGALRLTLLTFGFLACLALLAAFFTLLRRFIRRYF